MSNLERHLNDLRRIPGGTDARQSKAERAAAVISGHAENSSPPHIEAGDTESEVRAYFWKQLGCKTG
jgi:hypothetical protein